MNRLLLIIGLPILMVYISGAIGFERIWWFNGVDLSDPLHFRVILIVAFLALIQSAIIKLMLWQRDQRMKR